LLEAFNSDPSAGQRPSRRFVLYSEDLTGAIYMDIGGGMVNFVFVVLMRKLDFKIRVEFPRWMGVSPAKE
jgi:hypothetical protein